MFDKKKIEVLKRTRENFLKDSLAKSRDYWRDQETLQAYDETFARRILWKWQAVIHELESLGTTIPEGNILDFGCGTGVASEATSKLAKRQVFLHDRSRIAMDFACQKLLKMTIDAGICPDPDKHDFSTCIVSHILNELEDSQFLELTAQIRRASLLILVDAGTPEVAKRLAALRRVLLQERWKVIAPCTHNKPCPIESSADDWCHFHAQPPREIFQDADWRLLANEVGIDLRSLPVSYLVMTKDNDAAKFRADCGRLIGHPKQLKFGIRCYKCSENGYEDVQIKMPKNQVKEIQRDPFCVIL